MSKTVTIRFTNGESKKVVLGEEDTCVMAEPRGWGTECKVLVLKEDGFYHFHANKRNQLPYWVMEIQ